MRVQLVAKILAVVSSTCLVGMLHDMHELHCKDAGCMSLRASLFPLLMQITMSLEQLSAAVLGAQRAQGIVEHAWHHRETLLLAWDAPMRHFHLRHGLVAIHSKLPVQASMSGSTTMNNV